MSEKGRATLYQIYRLKQFERIQRKAERSFCRLRIEVEKMKMGKMERRMIFKDLLRAAGFCKLRMMERKDD